ncbi:hypothetical protein scyTo_0020750 [Scyliorhinus torazame]|uniref:Uncharacterized protein n=1 Tax=Scyliorhinus torazame TaxID=75743 RepID=A0A401Q142_SCYTO|nr:hypothetical protein [Scyliorhinus torazame]
MAISGTGLRLGNPALLITVTKTDKRPKSRPLPSASQETGEKKILAWTEREKETVLKKGKAAKDNEEAQC